MRRAPADRRRDGESASGAVGLTIRQQEWNSEIGSRIVEQRHIITERMTAREIGVRERLNPSFSVEDPEATVLAEYQGSGLPSIAVKKCAGWQTVFVGEPVLTWELLRGICKYAGVHLWTGGEDVAYIGNGWIVVHASRDGHRAVRLPEPCAVYDLTDRRLVATELREHRFFLKAGATRTLCAGTMDRFVEMGLPNLHVPAAAPPRSVPSSLPEPPPLPEPAPPPPALTADMETLQAVLSMDLSQIEDLPFEGLEKDDEDEEAVPAGPRDSADVEARLAALLPDAELLPAGRRRRRRGGRGRGRRRPEDETAAPGTAVVAGADGQVSVNGSATVHALSGSEAHPNGASEPGEEIEDGHAVESDSDDEEAGEPT